jgi:CheY-like chemotaxis protein
MPMVNPEKLILIVDDCKDIREVYSRFLTENWFRVASATDGQEALEEAVKLHPDLILMDLSLPGIGGRAAIQRLKKNQKTAGIPIIVVTGDSSDGVATVVKEGCAGFLIKPCVPDDLLREVFRVLERRAA